MQEYYLNSEKKICLMELSEFKELEGAYPHKRNLFRSMNPVQYCKAESYGDCLFGTMKIPRALKGRVTYIVFGFYLRGEELLLIEDGSFLKTCLGRLEKIIPTECSMHQFLVMIFEMLIEDDVIYLQQQEEKLASIEEELLKKIPEHFYEIILQYRKRFSAYHAYYEQLVNLADAMQSDFGQILTDKERSLWQLYANRVERLHDHVELLREYLVHEYLNGSNDDISPTDPDCRMVWHELSKYAGVRMEICVSGRYCSQHLHHCGRDHLF